MLKKVLALGWAIASLCAACSPGPPRSDGALVIGTTEQISSLDPALCYRELLCSSLLLSNTSEGLVRLDARLRVVPALATEWTRSADGRSYTFELRDGVRFHDGSPFDSAAAKASLERVRTLASPDTASFLLFDSSGNPPRTGITSIETPSEGRLVIRLVQPDAALLAKLAFAAASAVSPGTYPADQEAESGKLVGTGPYRLESRRPETIKLVRNEEYWGPKPRTERIEIRLFGTPAALRDAVEEGQIDIALHGFGPRDAAAFKKSSGLKVLEAPSAAVRMLTFNVRKDPLDDVHVRRAVAAAIDRRKLAAGVFAGGVTPLLGILPAIFGSRRDDFEGLSGSDIVGAELKQAGVAEGKRIALELWYTPTHYGDTEKRVAEFVQKELQATGRFDVTVRSSEWADYKASFARGDLGAYLLGWFPDYLDPEDYIEPFMATAAARALGSNYSDPTVDALLSEQRTTPDASRREAIFEELQKKAAADVPHVPLWEGKQFAVTRDGVGGLVLEPGHVVRLTTVVRK